MAEVDVAQLGASKDESGNVSWQAVIPITDDDNDVENLGEVQTFQGPGFYSKPYPKDENGYAECLVFRGIAGRSAICGPGRDTRSKIAAGMSPGDAVMAASGPEEAAQVRCLEKRRMVVLFTKDSGGDAMTLTLDGKDDKFQIMANGAAIEIDKSGNISLNAGGAGGASILIQGSNIFLNGTVRLPGMQPGQSLMMGPPTGQPAGNVAVLLMPVGGVGK